ncbi:hypothetical protein CYPRO_0433 [Cyclonatronum proteinivorum]|uniref:DUF2892 domain-containing protein n=1 Tax=Cyclonatronum proteinivorum TaxID=1457365 RepID=A0A345UGW8_9BACT|nr:hypothetical protein [Cyclonatronum proteinivorum]AXI99719.1 hypothetical protein CYPRO_0433 [Cyclonatronum proteinivorum]
MMNRLLTNWHMRRVLGLVIGLIFLVQSITFGEALPGFLALFFLLQAGLNVGCFGAQGCAPAAYGPEKASDGEIQYTEVK